MNFKMISYILNLCDCTYTDKLEIKHNPRSVKLYNIEKQRTLNLNNTLIDIANYEYMNIELDKDFQDELILTFYTYNDGGDSGMYLEHETNIITNIQSLDIFMIT